MVSTFVYYDPYAPPKDEDVIAFAKRERKMQANITTCTELLSLTSNEPRLKGTPPRVAPVASSLDLVRMFRSRRSRTNALTPPSSR